jgi:hypothetical protein
MKFETKKKIFSKTTKIKNDICILVKQFFLDNILFIFGIIEKINKLKLIS